MACRRSACRACPFGRRSAVPRPAAIRDPVDPTTLAPPRTSRGSRWPAPSRRTGSCRRPAALCPHRLPDRHDPEAGRPVPLSCSPSSLVSNSARKRYRRSPSASQSPSDRLAANRGAPISSAFRRLGPSLLHHRQPRPSRRVALRVDRRRAPRRRRPPSPSASSHPESGKLASPSFVKPIGPISADGGETVRPLRQEILLRRSASRRRSRFR